MCCHIWVTGRWGGSDRHFHLILGLPYIVLLLIYLAGTDSFLLLIHVLRSRILDEANKSGILRTSFMESPKSIHMGNLLTKDQR